MVISEETGSISIAHRGRILRRISADKLENVLLAFYKQQIDTEKNMNILNWVQRLFQKEKEPKSQ